MGLPYSPSKTSKITFLLLKNCYCVFQLYTCNCSTDILRSDSLNSYGMFHPNGPNFLLSWTKPWKKQSPNNRLRHSRHCGQLLKKVGSEIGSDVYDRSKFCLKPLGASFVIFTPKKQLPINREHWLPDSGFVLIRSRRRETCAYRFVRWLQGMLYSGN